MVINLKTAEIVRYFFQRYSQPFGVNTAPRGPTPNRDSTHAARHRNPQPPGAWMVVFAPVDMGLDPLVSIQQTMKIKLFNGKKTHWSMAIFNSYVTMKQITRG